MSLIEPNSEVPEKIQGKHWIGLPHTREQWAVHRQQGKWGYIRRSSTTWGFFLIFGVVNPIVALWIMGIERGIAYAVPGFLGGALGGIWMSHLFWKKCEAAWRADGQDNHP